MKRQSTGHLGVLPQIPHLYGGHDRSYHSCGCWADEMRCCTTQRAWLAKQPVTTLTEAAVSWPSPACIARSRPGLLRTAAAVPWNTSSPHLCSKSLFTHYAASTSRSHSWASLGIARGKGLAGVLRDPPCSLWGAQGPEGIPGSSRANTNEVQKEWEEGWAAAKREESLGGQAWG